MTSRESPMYNYIYIILFRYQTQMAEFAWPGAVDSGDKALPQSGNTLMLTTWQGPLCHPLLPT